MSNKLTTLSIIKLLRDHKSWHLEGSLTPHVEEAIHKDGWRYYTSCNCICIRNRNNNTEIHIGASTYWFIMVFAFLNTRKLRRKR